uniref:Uncharacterized protein n=1 Tax=Aegilops tauschii subsp. strangulata TaxID=200361 RepID=A0A453HMM0_AEGTS
KPSKSFAFCDHSREDYDSEQNPVFILLNNLDYRTALFHPPAYIHSSMWMRARCQ